MDTVELRDLVRPLLRWWWLLLLSTALATASAYWFASQQPDRFESRASVMIGGAILNPNPSGYEFFLAQQLVQTYADLINRTSVRESTMDALGLTWLPAYNARLVPNTQLMEIVVTDTDPVRAQAVAAELVRQVIRISPAGAQSSERQQFVEQELDDLQESITATKQDIARRQEDLEQLFSARQIADSEQQIAALQTKLTTLQTNYTALISTTQEGAVNAVRLVETPRAGVPVGENILFSVLLAAAVGFVLASVGAYLLEYLDDTMKNSDEVQKALGLATLGAVPLFRGDEKQHELIMLTKGQSPPAEAFRVLRTNLQFASVARELTTLQVTSPGPGEGKSVTSANLALALAQSGKSVVLMDADLHRPRLHHLFKLANNSGLTTALLGNVFQLERTLHKTAVPTLRVMTSGPLPPNPAELVGSQRMRDLLTEICRQTDIVIIDSPPVTAVADTAVLASQADGILLVLNASKTRRDVGKRALAALGQVNANVVGVVLNSISTKGSGYYYHYKYYRQYYRRDDALDESANVSPPGANVNWSFRDGAAPGGQDPRAPQTNGRARQRMKDRGRTIFLRRRSRPPEPSAGTEPPPRGSEDGAAN